MNWVPWRVSGVLARAVGRLFPVTTIREVPLPPGPVVFAFNHHSFLDAVVAGASGRRPTVFLATDEVVGHFKAVDFALRLYNVVDFDKTKVPIRPIRRALRALEEGLSVGVFPEGQRTQRFGEAPMKRGAAWLAARAGVPLIPVALIGTDQAMPIRDDLVLRIHRKPITVWTGHPIVADEHGGDSHAMLEAWRTQVAAAIEEFGAGEGI